MEIKKYFEFIKENKLTTESDVREFIREEWNLAKTNILSKISSKFNLKNNKNSEDDKLKIDNLMNQLINMYVDLTINNIEDFNKSWILPEDKIEIGDTVIDNETGDEYFVSKMGSNDNFYDENRKEYIMLNQVRKKI